MKKYYILLLLAVIIALTGCQQKKDETKKVKLEINGVKMEGEHTLKNNKISIDATNVEWLNPKKIKTTVTEEQLKKRYHVVREHYDKKTNTYQMVLLPYKFHYASEETNKGQYWVDADKYPKGFIVLVKEYSLVYAVVEITPKEDYTDKTDTQGYPFGQFDEDILDGLPTPSAKSIEVQDYMKGHEGMDGISHYSVQINF